MTARAYLFRIGLVIYLIGLGAFLARQQFGFHFFLLSLFYPVSQWALWALAGGVAISGGVGLFALATDRRKRRQRVWLGWGFMLATGIATAVVLHL